MNCWPVSILALFALAVAPGQTYEKNRIAGAAPPAPPSLRAFSDLVLVPTIVTDQDYRPIFNLRQSQFQLKVDKKEMPLSAWWKDTGPLSVVIVLDASGSMGNVLRQSQDAIDGFLKLAHPDDEYALVLCKDHAQVEAPFTSRFEDVATAMVRATAKGSTPLFDSLQLALELARKGRHERKAVLVVSDGEDTSSRVRLRTLRQAVLESTAYLYVLQFWRGCCMDEGPKWEPLRELAELTGGVYFDDVPAKRFADYFATLDLHQRYVLAFRPTQHEFDGKTHRVDVRLVGGAVRKPRVFWRHEYQDADPAVVR